MAKATYTKAKAKCLQQKHKPRSSKPKANNSKNKKRSTLEEKLMMMDRQNTQAGRGKPAAASCPHVVDREEVERERRYSQSSRMGIDLPP